MNDYRSNRTEFFYLAAALVVITLLVYAPVRGHAFLNWDDGLYVLENPHVLSGFTPSGLHWALTTFHAANWHPVTWLSHMLDSSLFGTDPGGHHITNLLVHTLNGVLLFFVLFKMTGAPWRSFSVAALFALHPLHVESVAWVSERKDLLSTCFSLLTMMAYTSWVQTGRRRAYVLCVAWFALALASKPMPVTLPLVLILLDYWPLERPLVAAGAHGWARRFSPLLYRFLEKWPLFLLTAASCIITLHAQKAGSAVATLEQISLPVRIQNAVLAYGTYIVKTFWPVHLSPIYPFHLPVPMGRAIGSLVILAAISLLVWRFRKLSFLPVGWLWFLGMLVPAIGIVHVGAQAMADRYTYMPHIGLFIMIVWGAPAVGARLRVPKIAYAVTGVGLVVLLSIVTFRQNLLWHDPVSLFGHAVQVNPRNHIAHGVLGQALYSEGRKAEAAEHYQAAIRLNSHNPQLLINLSAIAKENGRLEEALAYLNRALEKNPEFFRTHLQLGELYIKMKRPDQAVPHLQEAIRLLPDDPKAHTTLGVALANLRKWPEAEAAHRRALAISPTLSTAWNNLGYTLAMTGRLDEAIESFGRAVQYRPEFTEAIINWTNGLARKGNWEKVDEILEKGLQAQPENAELHFTLANSIAGRGHLDDAIDHYGLALRYDPEHVRASNNLAHALNLAGRKQAAMEQYRKTLTIDPRMAMAHNNLGLLLLQEGQSDKALDHFSQAIAISPGYANAHFNLGLLYSQRGDYIDAAARFKQVLDLRPDFAAAQYKLGETYLAMGEMEAAREAVSKLYALDGQLAKQLRDRLP